MSADKPTFRGELERLEAIVRQLEDKDIDLDEALVLFEEGVGRLQSARTLLEQAELNVQRVLEDADGTLRAERLDD